MDNVTMAEAKRLFSLGIFEKVLFATGFGDEDWTVTFVDGKGSSASLLPAKSRSPRIFKTLDAAVRAAREVGFKVSVLSA